ncbi:MAG: SCO family protein [Solirubrobacteraceae bacterium]|nr:SCO family protein [Solirubrobacteraceae bacterium]
MPRLRASGAVRLRAAALALTTIGLAAALAACGGTQEQQRKLHGFERTPTLRVGHLTLPDVAPEGAGQPMAFRASRSGLLLVFFGYTSCPDVCPTTLADISRALERIPASQRERVRVAMVTVDPRRDTRKVLNGYLSHFFSTWHALRADRAVLRPVEKAFAATSTLGPRDPSTGRYDVSHTAQVYVVDDRGTVRVEWMFGTKPADMAADLTTLLGEQPASSA